MAVNKSVTTRGRLDTIWGRQYLFDDGFILSLVAVIKLYSHEFIQNILQRERYCCKQLKIPMCIMFHISSITLFHCYISGVIYLL